MSQHDEVDLILSDWATARPDLDLAPLAVFSRMTRVTRHLDRARAQAFARSGLTAWEFDVLAVLRRGGAPFRQSPKTLVRQTMVSSGTMTNRIDRMASRGLVRRLTDPNDGRGVLVEMTDQGQTLVALGHGVRLLVAQHLQPVLDGPEIPIRAGQLGRRF